MGSLVNDLLGTAGLVDPSRGSDNIFFHGETTLQNVSNLLQFRNAREGCSALGDQFLSWFRVFWPFLAPLLTLCFGFWGLAFRFPLKLKVSDAP